jgi:hypothetical protein
MTGNNVQHQKSYIFKISFNWTTLYNFLYKKFEENSPLFGLNGTFGIILLSSSSIAIFIAMVQTADRVSLKTDHYSD